MVSLSIFRMPLEYSIGLHSFGFDSMAFTKVLQKCLSVTLILLKILLVAMVITPFHVYFTTPKVQIQATTYGKLHSFTSIYWEISQKTPNLERLLRVIM